MLAGGFTPAGLVESLERLTFSHWGWCPANVNSLSGPVLWNLMEAVLANVDWANKDVETCGDVEVSETPLFHGIRVLARRSRRPGDRCEDCQRHRRRDRRAREARDQTLLGSFLGDVGDRGCHGIMAPETCNDVETNSGAHGFVAGSEDWHNLPTTRFTDR